MIATRLPTRPGPPARRPAARPSSRPGIRAASPHPLGVADRPGRGQLHATWPERPRAAPPAARAPRRSAHARSRLARPRRPRRRERSGHFSCDTRLRPAYGSRRSGEIPRQVPSCGTGKRSLVGRRPDESCRPRFLGRLSTGLVLLKSGDFVGAAVDADLWDFCGARRGHRRLTQSVVQRFWPGFQGRVRGSARVGGSRQPGLTWLPYPADPRGPDWDRLLARSLLGRWRMRTHPGGGRDACPGRSWRRSCPGEFFPDLVWSSGTTGAAPGQRSYVSVMMRS